MLNEFLKYELHGVQPFTVDVFIGLVGNIDITGSENYRLHTHGIQKRTLGSECYRGCGVPRELFGEFDNVCPGIGMHPLDSRKPSMQPQFQACAVYGLPDSFM